MHAITGSPLWEISIIELRANTRIYYKVTRRMPLLTVAETRFFDSKEDALTQFYAWMNDS